MRLFKTLFGEAIGETEADSIDFGVLTEEAVVKSTTIAEAIAFAVESETGNKGDGVLEIGDFRGMAWFRDAVGARGKRLFRVEKVEMEGFEGFWVVRSGVFEADARESEAVLAGKSRKKGLNIDFALDGKIQ